MFLDPIDKLSLLDDSVEIVPLDEALRAYTEIYRKYCSNEELEELDKK